MNKDAKYEAGLIIFAELVKHYIGKGDDPLIAVNKAKQEATEAIVKIEAIVKMINQFL